MSKNNYVHRNIELKQIQNPNFFFFEKRKETVQDLTRIEENEKLKRTKKK